MRRGVTSAPETAVEMLPEAGAVRTLACLMLGAIGDILVTTPAIRGLRRRYPHARLTVIVREEFAELMSSNPDVDEVFCYRGGGALRKVGFLARLRLRHWDLWVDLHVPTYNTCASNSEVFKRNGLMMRAARTRFRVGFAAPELVEDLTHAVPVPGTSVLQTENIAVTTARLAGETGVGVGWKSLTVPESSRRWASEFLRDAGALKAPLIGLFFWGKQPADFWPEEQVEAFLRMLCDTYAGHRFLLLGGGREREAVERLRAGSVGALFPPIIDCAGKCGLLGTAALIERCRTVVSTDSGPMHMADALGVPVVALFSSKNYLPIWEPLVRPLEVLNVAVPCGPCLSDTCRNHALCMRSITPGDVLASLGRVLAASAEGAGHQFG